MNKDNSVDRYADIIDLPHPVSKKHPQMSLWDRAAQFAPFAALGEHDHLDDNDEQNTQGEG